MGLLKTENKNGASALQGLKEEVGQNPTLSRNGRLKKQVRSTTKCHYLGLRGKAGLS